jgi:hypothetical protein
MQLTPDKIVVGLGILLALWYLGASIFNRRRGVAVFRWLREPLDRFGGEVGSRWIGSSGSGAEIKVVKADAPFKQIEAIYLLASRELLPLWLFDMSRGKRDRLILKFALRASFGGEIEAVPARSGLAHQMRNDPEKPWSIEDSRHDLIVGTRGGGTAPARSALTPFLEKYGANLQRLSWTRQAPHLIITLSLADLFERGGNASDLYDDLAALVTAASGSS